MEFYERVLTARKAKGLSQEALAEELGVSRQAVSKWETGESKPDLDKLMGLCSTLELSMEYLCLGKESDGTAAVPVSYGKPRRRRPILTCLVAVVCAIACFVGGFYCYPMVNPPEPAQDITQNNELISCSDVLDALTVQVMTICNSHPEVVSDHAYCFEVNAYPEGLQMEVVFTYMNTAISMNPIRCSATHNGSHFTIDAARVPVGYTYRATAILTLGEVVREIPISLIYENTVFGRHWKSLG